LNKFIYIRIVGLGRTKTEAERKELLKIEEE
jgi:hypothetical protein